ncbi:MAG: STAS domain-containing protein [Acidobacteriota bacterium]|nr:MAG: STAS domain-containing protein [Acidobacteriota bacterium]
MKISARELGKIQVLDCDGPMRTGDSGPSLREMVHELLEQGHRKFLLNMAKVPWLDSGGIGEVVASGVSVRKAEGELKLLLSSRARDIFTTAQLAQVLDIHDSEESAVASFVI